MRFKKVSNPVYVYKNRHLIKPALRDIVKYFPRRFHRIFGAFGISLMENDLRLTLLKDKHKGERCFIVANGPSLSSSDLDSLKDEITFGCNKIYLAFGETEWRPTYYSVMDVLVAENNKDEIRELKLCKIFHECVRYYLHDESDATWVKGLKAPAVDGNNVIKFSGNSLEGVYGGWSVIYMQLQLAHFMGIKEIYLIGLDFSFDIPESTGEECASGEILEHSGEVNHFHPEYRKPGETWTVPKLELQYEAFVASKAFVEAHGGVIHNASRKTALDVFPLINFDSLVL